MPDRPRLFRGLRIAWSVAFGTLCVLLVVLWVRSYWRSESIAFSSRTQSIILGSARRQLAVFTWESSSGSDWWGMQSNLLSEMPHIELPLNTLGFSITWVPLHMITVPHWFAVLLVSAIA